MDILDQIGQDHEKADQLLEAMITGRGDIGSIASLRGLLLPHAKAEEAVLYPRLMEEEEAREHILEAVEEHRALELVLGDFEEAANDPERMSAKASVLAEMVAHHVEEEESTTFDFAREVWDEGELEEMREQFVKEKEKHMARA